MGWTREVPFWVVTVSVTAALSIFLSSSPVVARSRNPLKAILGEENPGSWKDPILNQSAEAPGPADDADTLLLAENRTRRPDILSNFHRYRGGWNIADKHYWASVGFTGAVAFIVAVLWLISFGMALVVHYCCGWKLNICSKESTWSLRICLLLLIIFTSAAAIGCILLSVGQNEFHGEALETLNYVVNQSEYIEHILRNVTGYLSLAKTVNVTQYYLSADVKDDIDRVNVDLNTAADTLEQKTDENAGRIQKVFHAVRSALITVAAVMLLISVVGLALSILGHQHVIHIFIITGWLLVGVTIILCGVFTIMNNAITDTCMAMGEWVENPQAETALSNILPCVDQRTTNQTLVKSKQVITNIVNIVNVFIGSVANSNSPPESTPNYYNQSGPNVPQLCYPYDSQLQDRQCSAQELSMENASLIWRNYTCTMSASGLCTSIGRLTPAFYEEIVAAVNVSYALEHYAPPLLSLQNCNLVRDAFGDITSAHCPLLQQHLKIVSIALAMISAGVMLSLALWMLYANRPQREEVFAKIRGSCSWKVNNSETSSVVSGGNGTTPRIGA